MPPSGVIPVIKPDHMGVDKGVESGEGGKVNLPNLEQAEVSEAKITEYLPRLVTAYPLEESDDPGT